MTDQLVEPTNARHDLSVYACAETPCPACNPVEYAVRRAKHRADVPPAPAVGCGCA